MEKRLDWELDGVKVDLETGDDWGLAEKENWAVLGDGVEPYGCALWKLYAGSMKKPLFDCLVAGHETGARGERGDETGEPDMEAFSYSARRQASEQ